MNLEARIQKQVNAGTITRPPVALQGITKARILSVLSNLARGGDDQIDVVFALLDNRIPNWFQVAAKDGFRFCDGATTAHIGVHVGMLQRGAGKLDREGRDYWCKPLWEIGAMERIFFDLKSKAFVDGWPIPKSPYCAYRLAASFVEILAAPEAQWQRKLALWSSLDATRKRLTLQAQLAAKAKASIDSSHEILIKAACETYAAQFLPGFELLYVDATDGTRVTAKDRARLAQAGVSIGLGDAMPDALFWNRESDWLWIIEAVTSDGEVDMHKTKGLIQLARRAGKAGIGFTTAYRSWRDAATRQGKLKNLAPGTFLWIAEDGSKQFKVESEP